MQSIYPKQTFAILLQGMDDDAFEKKFNTLEVDFIRSQQLFCRDVLKLSPGQRAVISNGRVSGHNTVQYLLSYFRILIHLFGHKKLNRPHYVVRKVKRWLNVAAALWRIFPLVSSECFLSTVKSA